MKNLDIVLEKINPNAAAIIKAVLKDHDAHVKSGKAQIVRGIILAVGDLYPQHRDVLLQLFKPPKKVKSINRIKVKFVDLSPNSEIDEPGCKGCKKHKNEKVLSECEDEKEVLEYFIGGVGEEEGRNKMSQFCKANGIKFHSSAKNETIASKIYEHIKNPTTL